MVCLKVICARVYCIQYKTFVVFTVYMQQITSGEYIQMSGRAGRRGLDERGICMLMVDEQMDATIGKNILKVRYHS